MKKQILSLGLALLLLMQSATLPLSASSENAESADQTISEEKDSSADRENAEPSELADEDYTHEISDAGLELIKGFEGYTRYAYWDYKQYSIGYGSYVESPDVYPDGITEREASDLLKSNLEDTAVYLNAFLVKYKILLNQNQFDALMSFSYNLGKYTWTKEDHALRNLILSQDYTDEELTETFGLYCHAGGKRLEALYKRRMREAAIFLSDYNLSDPDADLYVVNVSDSLAIREKASTSSTKLGSVKSSKIIRVHQYSSDGKWGFTSYNGYFGWVSTEYLVSIDEEESVTLVDESGHDDCKIHYLFDDMTMTATVGGDESTNSSHYTGEYGGDVYLTKYVIYNGQVYTLTGISDTAFRKCYTIRTIHIPKNVTEIGENAFTESTLQIIYYTDGSYAKTYAQNSPFEAIDERCKSGHTAGSWKVTVVADDTHAQVEERTCSVCKDVLRREYVGIEIVTLPYKTEYKEGIAFKQDGLTVRVLYSDGSSAMTKDFTVTGYRKNTLGTQTLTVKSSIFTDTFTVEVIQKSLTKITITTTPSKLNYIEGQAFVKTGLKVKAHYDNNTTASISASNCEVSGYDPNKIGTQTLTVTYNGKTATFKVEVRAKQLTSIQIVDYPDTLEYFCGEEFDSTGLKVRLYYDNDTSEVVDHRYVEVKGYDKTIAGTQTLTVVYKQMTQTFPVTVILNYLKSDTLRISDQYIAGVPEGITVGHLRNLIESGDRIEVLQKGKVLSDTDLITTGLSVRLLYNGEEQDTAILIVAGDLSLDGICDFIDFMKLSDYLMGNQTLDEMAMIAGDLDGDGYLTLADYCALYPLSELESFSGSV